MRSLSQATTVVTKSVFSRKYVALGRIVEHWSDIIGADLAGKAQPAGLKYRRPISKGTEKGAEKGKKPEAILEIATTSAHATRLHYQKDVILERINTVFGDRWVSDIRFKTVSSLPSSFSRSKQKKPSLSEEEENYINETLDFVTDKDVKERLKALGRSLITDKK